MEKIWFYYYSFLLMVLVAGMTYYLVSGIARNASTNEHYIGVNLTKDNGTCKVTWMGGWDFDSFYANVTVNGVNVGHPKPMTTIYNDTCKEDVVVKMYDKTVKSYRELYRYNNSGDT